MRAGAWLAIPAPATPVLSLWFFIFLTLNIPVGSRLEVVCHSLGCGSWTSLSGGNRSNWGKVKAVLLQTISLTKLSSLELTFLLT